MRDVDDELKKGNAIHVNWLDPRVDQSLIHNSLIAGITYDHTQARWALAGLDGQSGVVREEGAVQSSAGVRCGTLGDGGAGYALQGLACLGVLDMWDRGGGGRGVRGA